MHVQSSYPYTKLRRVELGLGAPTTSRIGIVSGNTPKVPAEAHTSVARDYFPKSMQVVLGYRAVGKNARAVFFFLYTKLRRVE